MLHKFALLRSVLDSESNKLFLAAALEVKNEQDLTNAMQIRRMSYLNRLKLFLSV